MYIFLRIVHEIYEQGKPNKVSSTPREDSDPPVHLPRLIGVFAVAMEVAWHPHSLIKVPAVRLKCN